MASQDREGWKGFFTGPAVRALRRFAAPEQTRAEADHLVDALALPAGARVLDVPCGDGRLSLELAARGFRATAVDLSAELPGHAREAGATSPAHPIALDRPRTHRRRVDSAASSPHPRRRQSVALHIDISISISIC
jgi:cyclopropane fatty-acyl-phospholipid synthase-like methyltransferase